MSNEIETNVAALVASYGVTFEAEYRGIKKNALGGKSDTDQWLCIFTKDSRPNEPEEFDFYTGMGCRAKPTKNDYIFAAREFQGLSENDRKGLTSYGRRYLAEVEKLRKPQKPEVASVLHSLMLDMDACEMSFEEWCNELGFNSDSIKDQAVYFECQKSGDKLKKIFTHAQFEELREALQDY